MKVLQLLLMRTYQRTTLAEMLKSVCSPESMHGHKRTHKPLCVKYEKREASYTKTLASFVKRLRACRCDG